MVYDIHSCMPVERDPKWQFAPIPESPRPPIYGYGPEVLKLTAGESRVYCPVPRRRSRGLAGSCRPSSAWMTARHPEGPVGEECQRQNMEGAQRSTGSKQHR
jgi:hypothetical protein